jgi:pimeloyl-ACP methyl ester carboxylesterase
MALKGLKTGGHNLVAQYFAENGFRYLKFNFSHNGTTADQPCDFSDLIAFSDNTFSIELDDLKAVIDFVYDGPAMPSATEIYLIGHSMGGGISIIKTAGDKRIKKLVTMASIADFRNLWPKETEAQWRLQGIAYFVNKRTGQQMPLKVSSLVDLDKNPKRLDILANAAKVTQPWLIIHGDADPTVPVAAAKELKAAQPNTTLLIIPGADHTFGGSQPELADTLPQHLEQFCKAAVDFFNINSATLYQL